MSKRIWKDELTENETPEVVETEVEVVPVEDDNQPNVTVVKEDIVTYRVTSTNGLNVRKSPSKDAQWMGVMGYHEPFQVSKTDGDWGYIPEKDGWALLIFAERV